MKWLRFALIAFLLAGIAGVSPALAQGSVPRFESGACRFQESPEFIEGKNLRCGYLAVPEDRSRPNGPTIRLAVAVFQPKTATASDPVFFLSGGPGDPLLSAIGPILTSSRIQMFFGDHPLVLLDQRGTGYSQPFLGCTEYDDLVYKALNIVDSVKLGKLSMAAARQCHAHLANLNINVDAYNTIEDAADVDALRTALGYKQIDLYGVSYGTRLAETVMRLYPSGVRSVVLDSVVPLQEDLYTGGFAAMAHAFQVLFSGCAADAACNSEYPHLSGVFTQTARKLNARPIRVQVIDPNTGAPFTVTFNGVRFGSLVFNAQYAAPLIPLLPKLIWKVSKGKHGLLKQIAADFLFPRPGESAGMFLSVVCSEDAPFVNADQLTAARNLLPAPLRTSTSGSLLHDPDPCQAWNVPAAPAAQKQPLSSTIPTLILDGEYDPITPPSNGELAQATLPNSYRFVFPAMGHAVLFSDSCPEAMVSGFFNHPQQKPDDFCISGMAEPKFE